MGRPPTAAYEALQRSTELKWARWAALVILALALGFVLRCLVSLQRQVAPRLLQRTES